MPDTKQLFRRWIWGLGILALFIVIVWRLENLSTLVLLTFLMAYVLNPLVTRLTRLRFISRTVATLIAMSGLLFCFLAILFFIIPGMVGEFRILISKMPAYINYLKETAVPWIEQRFAIDVPLSLGEALDQFGQNLSKIAPKLIGPVTTVIARTFGGTFSIFSVLLGAFMFPLFLFFLLKDFPRIVNAVYGLIPIRNRESLSELGTEVDLSLSAFLHGQFIVMIVLASLYSIGYSIVGIPVAIGVGLLTGVLCFIPYVGAATGFILALFLAILELQGFGSVFGVVCIFVGVQLLDATLITPKILGGKLGLRPLWIIIALMAGGELFGFLGVLLAVPTTAVLKVVVTHGMERYKASNLYRSPTAPDTPAIKDE
jgi:predicted PurR-regulated permease PerM